MLQQKGLRRPRYRTFSHGWNFSFPLPAADRWGKKAVPHLLEHEATVQELSTGPGLQEVFMKLRQRILGPPFSAQSTGVCHHTLPKHLSWAQDLCFLRCEESYEDPTLCSQVSHLCPSTCQAESS